MKHILLDCIDLRDTRIKYYKNINNLKDLFNGNVKSICNFLKKVDYSSHFSELIYSVFCVNLLWFSWSCTSFLVIFVFLFFMCFILH